MHVLIVNDDGISSRGLLGLAEALHSCPGISKLSIVAPKSEQSGVGHHISLRNSVHVDRYQFGGALSNTEAYVVDGTPADCVKVALTALLRETPVDLIASGINRGPNVGTAVFYSGTVAAAREGVLNGVQSVALSLDYPQQNDWNYDTAAILAKEIVQELLRSPLPQDTLLNVNIPHLERQLMRGVRLTQQGRSRYDERFVAEPISSRGGVGEFSLQGTFAIRDPSDHFEAPALSHGYVSVTPVSVASLSAEQLEAIGSYRFFHSRSPAT